MGHSGATGQTTYRIISWLLSPLVIAHLIWRSFHDGGWQYFKQRLGFAQPKTDSSRLVWVHAASVGEINTALPLLRTIQARWPSTSLLVSTNTPTGYATLKQHNLPATQPVYLPVDYSSAIKRFFLHHQISFAIIIETEVWPMLYEQASMPLIIVNGRLTQRTLRVADSVLKPVFKRAAEKIHTVLARSEGEVPKFAKLGVPEQRIKATGNLKYAMNAGSSSEVSSEPLLPQNYCLLASTHANEEVDIAAHWLQHPAAGLLVIAPRHPDRSAAIEKQLIALGAELCVRSRGETVTETTRFYLADTLGELPRWFQFASDIFMGGSLIPHGGHNMLEAAQLGKRVIVGPYTHNFAHETDLLREVSAIREAKNAAEVVQIMLDSVESPNQFNAAGRRAFAVVDRQQHVTEDYAQALSPFFDNE